MSKVASDVLESLEFLRVASTFDVDGAEQGIIGSLSLVWSEDENVRNGLVSTYVSLYLTTSTQGTMEHAQYVLKNLLRFVSRATTGEKASLEKLVELLMAADHIPELAVKELWKIYLHSSAEDEGKCLLPACMLLSMTLATKGPESNYLQLLEQLMKRGLTLSSS